MKSVRIDQSIVTRLVAGLVVGGLLMSAIVALLNYQRTQERLRRDLTRQSLAMSGHLKSALRMPLHEPDRATLAQTLSTFAAADHILAVRLTGDDFEPLTFGDAQIWNGPTHLPTDTGSGTQAVVDTDAPFAIWTVDAGQEVVGTEIDLLRSTLVRVPFLQDGNNYLVEFVVNGPAANAINYHDAFEQMMVQWLLIFIMMLIGLLLLRRWITGPLQELGELVGNNVCADSYYRLSREYQGEFRQLAEAVGGMVTRIDTTSQQLHQREQAFSNLYQFAPTAMLSIEPNGIIQDANRRAAQLLGVKDEQTLIGRNVEEYIQREHRDRLRTAQHKLELSESSRCEVQLIRHGAVVDAVIECSGVRNSDYQITGVRLAFLDISESRKLQRELENKSALLNLIIDHMSDAIVLVDNEGVIAAHNQQLISLLHRMPDSVVNKRYDAETFWCDLGITDESSFTEKMRRIEKETTHPTQERIVTTSGVYLFQSIPVYEVDQRLVGRLWVVEEITTQEETQRLIEQQSHQLLALRSIAHDLAGIADVDDLLLAIAKKLYEVIGVEAVGVALRGGIHRRTRQMLHRGESNYLLQPNAELVGTVEKLIMPEILAQRDVTFWPDLPRKEEWARKWEHAGLSCLAGVALRGLIESQGIIWIARRGGERLSRQHIHMLETLAPLIAARVEVAQLTERLSHLDLVDAATGLPSRQQFNIAMSQYLERPDEQWALFCFGVDGYVQRDGMVKPPQNVLRTVASVLLGRLRQPAMVSYVESAVFAVIIPNIELRDAFSVADRLREAIQEQEDAATQFSTNTRITASVGLAIRDGDQNDPYEVFHLATARMNEAARRGGNQIITSADTIRMVG